MSIIPEIGHFALTLALAMAVVLAVPPIIGAARGHAGLMAVARPAAHAQFLFLVIAFGCLSYSFLVNDFSVAYVAQNSNSLLPWYYRLSAVWGAHEGSLLLWGLLLGAWTWAVAVFSRRLPLAVVARVLSVMGMISIGFLLFMLFTSNPFERLLPAAAEGRDLNPLLQDVGLIVHPPLLYMGYVGFSVAFAFAIAALLGGNLDAAWARWSRPWTTVAWVFLTLGIAMGSYWAYYELGWGGWWFWDPVENASLMPWLIGAALLHSAIVVEKRDALKTWTILLAILAFSLSLVGTFLVRSGVLTSVHAFAVDPARGVFILAILVVTIGGSLALYAVRAPALKTGGLFAPISREGGLVLNNLLLATATATVFLGTLYPLFLDAIGGAKVSVGPPFFNATFVPLMVPLVAAIAVGPMLAWKRGDLPGALARLWAAGVAAAVAVLGTLWLAGGPAGALLGLGLAAWLGVGALVELAERIRLFRIPASDSFRRAVNLPRAAWGMTVAHLGVAVVVAGITASSAWQTERIQLVRPGETVEIAGYTLLFRGTERVNGPNYVARRGIFEVSRDGEPVTTLYPAKRFYPVQGMVTTEAAIHTNLVADLYVVIGDPDSGGTPGGDPRVLLDAPADAAWAARLYYNPLVPWIWIGCVIMVLGGALSLSDRRHRVGAPSRARRPIAQPAMGD